MPARLIDGRAIAARIKEEVRQAAAALRRERGITPGLAVILVGEDPGSQVYVRSKEKTCREMGFFSVTERLSAGAEEETVLALIKRFAADPRVHGILVQTPLPPHFRDQRIMETIPPEKDVDGFHPLNVGRLVIGQPSLRPCTPAGIQELLLRSGYDPSGKHVVVVGRSNLVGKPVANILLQKQRGANAVVTVVHTGAPDLRPFLRQADVVIAAAGRPGFITGEMLKPGCVVIDVGINRITDPERAGGTRLVGDVDFPSASEVAGAITPVPGGVGPMTIAMLMKNTLEAASCNYGHSSLS
jgi:methylenetetrahydrofolate dehydrogenase (NADP+)/methenyltetrahydrofolate cyclohydrolase